MKIDKIKEALDTADEIVDEYFGEEDSQIKTKAFEIILEKLLK